MAEPFETFETLAGELRLRHVPLRWVIEITARYEMPEEPTYSVKTASGEVVDFKHDAKSIEQTPGAEVLWAAYEVAKARAELERDMAVNQFLLDQVVVDEPPPLDEWGIDYGRWGLEAPDPEDAIGFKRRWIEEVHCPDANLMAKLLLRCYRLSGLEKGRLDLIESFFRPSLAGATPGVADRQRHPAPEVPAHGAEPGVAAG